MSRPAHPTTSLRFDPSLAHLSSSTFLDVYEPAEDTYLLVDVLHQQLPFLTSTFPIHRHPSPLCVEVGSGSGMVISYLSNMMGGRGLYWATDINQKAAQATRETMKHNKVHHMTAVWDSGSEVALEEWR